MYKYIRCGFPAPWLFSSITRVLYTRTLYRFEIRFLQIISTEMKDQMYCNFSTIEFLQQK